MPLPAPPGEQRLLRDDETDEAFNRLVQRAVEATGAAAGYVCLLVGDGPFLRGCVDLPETLTSGPERALPESLCAYAPTPSEPLAIEDVRDDPALDVLPALAEHGIRAYMSVPLLAGRDDPIGLFSVVDDTPRAWSGKAMAAIRNRAASAESEIELHLEKKRKEFGDRFDSCTDPSRRCSKTSPTW